MTFEELARALWRRKWVAIATVIVAVVATYLISDQLPKVYETDATLYIKDPTQEASSDFEAIQSAQVLAKTYAELIQSENVADQVAARLRGDDTGADLLAKVGFEPLPDTQLIVINAEGNTAREAATLANTYADVFVDYVSGVELGNEIEGEATVADVAVEPSEAVRPRPRLYAGIAGVFGIFLGAGLALLRDRLDRPLGTSEEISEALGAPILARVPGVARRRSPMDSIREDAFAEAMRVLLANLRFVSRGRYPSSVLITSPGPGDGKSTICMGLARVAAEHDATVVVLEGDMRRPVFSRRDRDEHVRDGLTRVLAQEGPLDEGLDEILIEPPGGVMVLPAGRVSDNPSALLQPDTLNRLMKATSRLAELAIIDSPPVSVGPDAMLLAQPASATILVVNHRRTSRAAAQAAARQLKQAGAHLLGVVVNEVPSDEHNYYSYGRTRARGGPFRSAGQSRESA